METPPHDVQNLMPGRRTTRSALAEIPAQLGMMSLTHDNEDFNITQVNHMTPGPGNPLWHMNNNLPSSMMSPSPSPDEMIIQSRGRRRLPAIWSPDIDNKKPAPGNRTPVKTRDSPTKNATVSSIVLRSTPRKRLLMNDPKDFPSPDKKTKSPISKKIRLERMSLFSGTLEDSLKGLSQDQLIAVIQQVVASNPQLEQSIKESLPEPDMRPLEERLSYLKKNIFKSLPNSRLTSKTDSPAYSRAATHLSAFKKCVVEQGRQLVDSQHWSAAMEYGLLAWSYVRATPLWDNPPHNAVRKQCFKSLASQIMTAIRCGHFTDEELERMQKKLEDCNGDSEDMQPCIKHIVAMRADKT